MVCPRCGAEIAPGKAFCGQCGQRVGMADGIRPPIAPAALRPKSPVMTPQQAIPVAPPVETTFTEPEPQAGKGKGGLFAGILLLILLVLGIFGGVWAYQGKLPVVGDFPFPSITNSIRRITSHSILDLVPQDSIMMAEINSDQDSASYTNLETLWHLFPKYQEWEDSLFSGVTDDTSPDSAITWDADVEPWLGDEVVAFMGALPSTADTSAETAPMGFIVRSSNMDATRTFINTLVEQEKAKATTSTYKDITIIQLESGDASSDILPDANSLLSNATASEEDEDITPSQGQLAYIDSYLVVTSTRKTMESVIDTYQGADRFSQKSGFTQTKADLPVEAIARIYIDMSAMLDYATANEDVPTLTSTASFLTDSTLKDAYGLGGFAITAQKDGLLMTSTAAFDQAKLTEAGLSSSTTAFTPSLAESVPADVALYTESADLEATIQDMLAMAGSSDPSFEESYTTFKEQLSGFPFSFDIDEDLLGWMNGRYAVTLAPQGTSFAVSIIFTIEDQEVVAASLEKIRGMLTTLLLTQTAAGENVPLTLFEQQTVAGTEVWTVKYPNLPDYAQISYAFVGDHLILTNTPQSIASFVEVENGTKAPLMAKPMYTSLLDRFPREVTSLVYLDPEPLWTIARALYTVMPEATDETVSLTTWEQDLAPFHAIMGVSTVEDDQEKGEIFVSIEK